MSERRYEAKERTVNRMTRGGLLEESLQQPVTADGKRQGQKKYRQMDERARDHNADQKEGSPEGGNASDERSFDDKGKHRKTIRGSIEKPSKEGRQSVSGKMKKRSPIDAGLSRVKYPRKIPGTKEAKKQKKS